LIVYRHEEESRKHFFVGRLLLDAAMMTLIKPTRIACLYWKTMRNGKNDQWILVKGKRDRIKVGDKERNVILPETIEKAEIPDDPYIILNRGIC
jgi:uncharacterized membrane protein YcgQ (UPF0703/DUF1980 family)